MASLSSTTGTVIGSDPLNAQRGIAGAAIVEGDVIYKDPADNNKLKLSDANAAAPANSVSGVALTAAAVNQPVQFAPTDPDLTPGFTALAGDPIYLSSDNPGKSGGDFTLVRFSRGHSLGNSLAILGGGKCFCFVS